MLVSSRPRVLPRSIFAGTLAALAAAPLPALAEEGRDLFEANCAVCHGAGAQDGERAAPPVFGVINHYKQAHPDKEAFTAAIVKWLEKPEEGKALMPGAIERFGLMPALELEEGAAEKIAAFLYDADVKAPGWYREHYRQEHGLDPQMPPGEGAGMGHGQGMKNGQGMGHGRHMEHGKGWGSWLRSFFGG